MTSDVVKAPDGASEERVRLDYALGNRRVRLSGMRVDEFDQLLLELLRSIGLREIRGFVPLEKYLLRRERESRCLPDDLEFLTSGFDNNEPTLKTHVLQISREVIDYSITYGRHETDEETEDDSVQREWGKGAYVKRGWYKWLLVTRPPNHSGAGDNLVEVEYHFTKVPTKQEHSIHRVIVRRIKLENFREHLGSRAFHIAHFMFSEIRTILQRTQGELTSQVSQMERHVDFWERFGGAIME